MIEIATKEIMSDGKKAFAHVTVDRFKKLQLVISSFCPVHVASCDSAEAFPPRNVSLRELRLLGIDGIFLIKSLHETLNESLVGTMISMPGPSMPC